MPRGTLAGDPEFDPATGPGSDLNVVNRMFEGQTLASRMVSYRQAWDDFTARPLFGNGANSFGQKYTTTAHTPGWISNAILMSFHDTGVIGTLLLLAWFAWFAWMTVRGTRGALPSASRAMVAGLGIGLVCLLLAYQVTSMFWFGLMWWLFAVMESGVKSLAPEPVS
jgi:O-antigen ligase